MEKERGISTKVIFCPRKIQLESWRQVASKLIETLDEITFELNTKYSSIEEMLLTMNTKYQIKGYYATFSYLTKTVFINTRDPFDLGFIVGTAELL